MKVSIIGTGYVGLVSGVCLAERGHYVTCVDIDPNRVEQINQGITPIHEEGLDTLLEKNLHHHLFATTDLSTAIQQTELSIIAVGTPFNRDQGDRRFKRTFQAPRRHGSARDVAGVPRAARLVRGRWTQGAGWFFSHDTPFWLAGLFLRYCR
jgi:UDP-glucose 6-dehydrogenase